MAAERLQKLLARAGVASRRAAERLIVEGKVFVNGRRVTELGSRADYSECIEVDGIGRLQANKAVYLLLHKPPFVISSVTDPEGRDTVLNVVQNARGAGNKLYGGELPPLVPVGRLDFDAEGALLLTNDGPLVNALLHPSHHVPKVYTVKVRGQPDASALRALRDGIALYNERGHLEYRTKPAEARVVRLGPSNAWIELTLLEGRSHQVKRMCEAIRHPVVRLVRTSFANIDIGELPTGAWRFLTPAEVAQLQAWPQQKPALACKSSKWPLQCAPQSGRSRARRARSALL